MYLFDLWIFWWLYQWVLEESDSSYLQFVSDHSSYYVISCILFLLTLNNECWNFSLVNVHQICSAVVINCIWESFYWHFIEILKMMSICYECVISCFSAWKLVMRDQILNSSLFKMKSESFYSLKSTLNFSIIMNKLIKSYCC